MSSRLLPPASGSSPPPLGGCSGGGVTGGGGVGGGVCGGGVLGGGFSGGFSSCGGVGLGGVLGVARVKLPQDFIMAHLNWPSTMCTNAGSWLLLNEIEGDRSQTLPALTDPGIYSRPAAIALVATSLPPTHTVPSRLTTPSTVLVDRIWFGVTPK